MTSQMSGKVRLKFDPDKADLKEFNLCQISALKLSCFGCCGHDYGMRKKIYKAIKQNTHELDEFFAKYGNSDEALKKFRDRKETWDLHPCGVCRNIVFDKTPKSDKPKDSNGSKVFCPLHPLRGNDSILFRRKHPLIKGKDLRENHCDTDHLCNSYIMFEVYDEKKKRKFLAYLKRRVEEGTLDWCSYSLGMEKGKLVKEFEENLNK